MMIIIRVADQSEWLIHCYFLVTLVCNNISHSCAVVITNPHNGLFLLVPVCLFFCLIFSQV